MTQPSTQEEQIANLQHSLSWALGIIQTAPSAADMCPWHGRTPFPHSCPYYVNEEWIHALDLLENEILTANWLWDDGKTQPASGQVQTDTATWSTASALKIHVLATDSTDATAELAVLKVNDQVKLQEVSGTRWVSYKITGPGSVSGQVYSYPVTYLKGAGAVPPDSTQLKVTLMQTIS